MFDTESLFYNLGNRCKKVNCKVTELGNGGALARAKILTSLEILKHPPKTHVKFFVKLENTNLALFKNKETLFWQNIPKYLI